MGELAVKFNVVTYFEVGEVKVNLPAHSHGYVPLTVDIVRIIVRIVRGLDHSANDSIEAATTLYTALISVDWHVLVCLVIN